MKSEELHDVAQARELRDLKLAAREAARAWLYEVDHGPVVRGETIAAFEAAMLKFAEASQAQK
jgi:hypothetical protein